MCQNNNIKINLINCPLIAINSTFFGFFNSILKNIAFTTELENNHLAFLYVLIAKIEANIETTVLKKQLTEDYKQNFATLFHINANKN